MRLKHVRECCMRANEFNCRPNFVFEQHDKLLVNEVAKTVCCWPCF